ncbi:MAG TPA: (2Fe-2S)-binding protein [Candidatus Sulfomarinibacteraceae bacterium]|nr:(2Fe-2S)-binding protein [Candidatus Sulfomarinibacteraceae bacterium]
MATSFRLRVNGEQVSVTADGDEPLLWVLRDRLGLTGTKFGCGEGECGACSVLINGEAYRSCMVPLSEVAPGDEVVTIEGLGRPGALSALQQAFIDHTAFGCGFCTPGMIVTAEALLRSNPAPSRGQIVAAMDDNLCRCASYPAILKAIESSAGGRAGEED